MKNVIDFKKSAADIEFMENLVANASQRVLNQAEIDASEEDDQSFDSF